MIEEGKKNTALHEWFCDEGKRACYDFWDWATLLQIANQSNNPDFFEDVHEKIEKSYIFEFGYAWMLFEDADKNKYIRCEHLYYPEIILWFKINEYVCFFNSDEEDRLADPKNEKADFYVLDDIKRTIGSGDIEYWIIKYLTERNKEMLYNAFFDTGEDEESNIHKLTDSDYYSSGWIELPDE